MSGDREKRADRVIKHARDAFDREVESWAPKKKVLKIGDRVKLTAPHLRAGEFGLVVRFEANELFPNLGARAVVRLDGGREVYVSQVDEWVMA